jgi:hypothetical protein
MEQNLNNKISTLNQSADQGVETGKRIANDILDKIRNFHSKYPELFYIIVVIIIVIIVVILIKLVKRKIKWNRENPVFFRTGVNVSKQDISIPNDSLHRASQSNSSSMFFWVNIDAIDSHKESTLLKGESEDNILDTKYIQIVKKNLINNLEVIVKEPYNTFIIEDYPMNRWFSITVIIIDNYVEVYIDGKLIKTKYIETNGEILLKGTDNSDITLGPFKGEISSFTFSSNTYTAQTVNQLERRGPLTNSWLVRLFGYLSDLETQPKCEKKS